MAGERRVAVRAARSVIVGISVEYEVPAQYAVTGVGCLRLSDVVAPGRYDRTLWRQGINGPHRQS